MTAQSINRTYDEGATATLMCTSSGGPNNTYQWQTNGTDLEDQDSQILTLPNVTASTGELYTCVVSNTAGNDSISTFVFISPYFEFHPSDHQVSPSSNVVLVCGAVSFPNPEYLWQRVDGGNITSGAIIERILNISSVQYGDEGEYFCNASIPGGNTVQSQNGLITGKVACTSIYSLLLLLILLSSSFTASKFNRS